MTKPTDSRSVETLLANVRNALDELEARILEGGGVVAAGAPVPPDGPKPPNQQ